MDPWPLPPVGLVVNEEVAELSYTGDAYTARIRRSLYNAGDDPVTRYLVRVSVDRYPTDPDKSNNHYRRHPLTFDSLALTAVCGEADEQEPMNWRVKQDRDALKELWLLFENEQGRFPLYPGQRTTIEYRFRVSEQQWGAWFQRAIRLPTSRLRVALDLPASRAPQVWGVEIDGGGRCPRTVTRHRDGAGPVRWETERRRYAPATDWVAVQVSERVVLDANGRHPQLRGLRRVARTISAEPDTKKSWLSRGRGGAHLGDESSLTVVLRVIAAPVPPTATSSSARS